MICDAFRKVSELSVDWASRMVFVMQFRLFWKKRDASLIENHQEMASRYDLRQTRDLLVYELQHLDREIGRLGGFMRYYHLKAIGGNVKEEQ